MSEAIQRPFAVYFNKQYVNLVFLALMFHKVVCQHIQGVVTVRPIITALLQIYYRIYH